jgi:hypothetical protein
MVQRRGARHVCNRQGNISSVDSMLDTLKWKSLQRRRRDARLHMLYKTYHEDVAISKEERLIPPKRTTRNMHPLSFQVPSSSSDYRKYSFFPRTIRDWNSLPTNTAAATILVAFKAQVRERPFNLQGRGDGCLFRSEQFCSDNTRVRILIFFVALIAKFFSRI